MEDLRIGNFSEALKKDSEINAISGRLSDIPNTGAESAMREFIPPTAQRSEE